MNAGDLIYRKTQRWEHGGLIDWVTIERREIVAVTDSSVTASNLTCVVFPTHTPPAGPIAWPPTTATSIVLSIGDVGPLKTWDTTAPELPEREVIDDAAVEQDYLAWANTRYVSRDTGRPKPVITDEQRRLFAIHEYRQGLLAL
jgi:hypothetical protein